MQEKHSKKFNYEVSSGDFPGVPAVRTPELPPQGPPGWGTKFPSPVGELRSRLPTGAVKNIMNYIKKNVNISQLTDKQTRLDAARGRGWGGRHG